jgi:hypothetical protein
MEMMMERAIASVSFEAAETLHDVMLPTSSHPGFHSTDLPKDCWIIFAGLRRPRCLAQLGHLPHHHTGSRFSRLGSSFVKTHASSSRSDPKTLDTSPFLTRLLCTLSPSHRSANSTVQQLLPRRNRSQA